MNKGTPLNISSEQLVRLVKISVYVIAFYYVVRYTFFYWVMLLGGIVSTLVILVYNITFSSITRPNIQVKRPKKFNFINKWSSEVEDLAIDENKLNEPILHESFLISETLDELMTLIMKQFVDGWYRQISNSTVFQESITIELKQVIRNLVDRLVRIDFAKLLVSRLIPILHEHFQHYVKAEEAVRIKTNINKIDSAEYQIAVALQYDRGKIHPGVTTSSAALPNSNEKKYLRTRISQLLPYLLSENERNNEIVLTFVTEILACTILTSIFQMVGEGDFYNMLIVKLIGDNLKHRDQVKQLRAALEEHTQLVHKSAKSTDYDPRYTITAEMDTFEFRDVIKSIDSLISPQEIKQIESYIVFQLKNTSKIMSSETAKKTSIKRLQTVRSKLKERYTKVRSENDESTTEVVDNLQLSDIINSPSALRTFSEYLNYKDRLYTLQCWKAIDDIKAPLEDSVIGEDGETNLSLSLEFSTIDDISNMYTLYFDKPELPIDDEMRSLIKSLVCENGKSHSLDLYQSCRRVLFKLQKDIFQNIEEGDFQSFKKSSFFSKLVNLDALSKVSEPPLNTPEPIFEDTFLDSTIDSGLEHVSPDVFRAVENAFTQIMQHREDKGDGYVFEKSAGMEEENPVLTINMKKSLFGETSSLFGTESNDTYSKNNRHSKLFDDLSEESGTDSDSIVFDSDSALQDSGTLDEGRENSSSQIYLAGPGNLSLAEEIANLTVEIDKLNEQLVILEPLLKKAELTHNIGELKILRKSKLSLDREINAKELQKQQYIVQENDNSLYGKSRLTIQSYISGNENGKEFILYIVEVQKLSNDDPSVVSAGWIVARRFSQFFKLHEYLKLRYGEVGAIKFPKRTVLVLKFQQRQLVDLRKAALEEYLQALVKIPQVCSNRAFRSFLSSENFYLSKNESTAKNNIETVANKLYNGISSRFNPVKPMAERANEAMLENLHDMQQELRQFDEVGSHLSSNKDVFVKPICDLLIAVFRLNNTQSWLRGRALIVILQQIFGTTIEKKVTEQVNLQLRTEESVLDLVIWLKNTLFHNGKFRDPPIIRTLLQQSATRDEAKVLLGVFMNETCSKIFGTSNTNSASTRLFDMLQNDYLNRHLILEIFDQLIDECFPGLGV